MLASCEEERQFWTNPRLVVGGYSSQIARLTCSWSRGWMVSSQSLMRWLSSVSWINFWEVAMKSSYRRTSEFSLARMGPGYPQCSHLCDPGLPHFFGPAPHISGTPAWPLHLERSKHELLQLWGYTLPPAPCSSFQTYLVQQLPQASPPQPLLHTLQALESHLLRHGT